ncbi:MAG: hypothetical protein H6R16_3056 [Proteobacteria bacterium]|nr:hypothetical protein [Pseudomonadota bacterium]
MADVLLSLTLPNDVAQHVEDLLLSRPDLVRGFTASVAEGHGSVVQLVEPGELVAGHSPRTQIRTVGPEENMRAVLELIKSELPRANVFFWLVPVIEMGRV